MNFINQLLENFEKRRVYSSFKYNIWGVDPADIQLISKYNKRIYYVSLIFLVNMHGLFI